MAAAPLSPDERAELIALRQQLHDLQARLRQYERAEQHQLSDLPLARSSASPYTWADIFQYITIGVALSSADGTILEMVNPAFAAMHGYTCAELKMQPVAMVLAPAMQGRIPEVVQQSNEQQPYLFESQHIRKDGSSFPVLVDISIVRDATGQVRYRIVNVQDISEHKQAVQALAASEQRYRTLIETSPSAILLTDMDSTITFCNQQAAHLFGCRDSSELMGSRLIDHVVTNMMYHPHELLRMMVTSGDIRNLEQTMRRRDGSRFDVEMSSSMVQSTQGQPTALFVVLSDISAYKQAAQALTAAYKRLEALNRDVCHSRNLLQALFDGLKDGFVLLDNTGTVQIANRALAALLTSQPKDLVGQTWESILAGLIPSDTAQHMDYSNRHDAIRSRRVRYQNPDGSLRILDIHTIALHDPAQTSGQRIVHVQDMTEYLQLQARVIENERFAASGRLAASVAHEINTPLLSLDFSLEMAQIAPDEEQPTFLAEARQEIQRIARIVRQLLDLYRPGNTTCVPVDINALLERVLLLIGKWIRDQGIVIKRSLTVDLEALEGRTDELMQVFLNLIINAMQAMPDGGTLSVATKLASADAVARATHTDAAKLLVISITDTGHGINPDLQQRIFEPFVTTRAEGTGLGLAISKQIILQYNGCITVQSKPGIGSTFTVLLPLCKGTRG